MHESSCQDQALRLNGAAEGSRLKQPLLCPCAIVPRRQLQAVALQAAGRAQIGVGAAQGPLHHECVGCCWPSGHALYPTHSLREASPLPAWICAALALGHRSTLADGRSLTFWISMSRLLPLLRWRLATGQAALADKQPAQKQGHALPALVPSRVVCQRQHHVCAVAQALRAEQAVAVLVRAGQLQVHCTGSAWLAVHGAAAAGRQAESNAQRECKARRLRGIASVHCCSYEEASLCMHAGMNALPARCTLRWTPARSSGSIAAPLQPNHHC